MNEAIAKDQLQQFISSIETLEESKAEIAEEIKAIFESAKSSGFDTKTMKKVLRLRKLDRDKLAEEDAILELYRAALGL